MLTHLQKPTATKAATTKKTATKKTEKAEKAKPKAKKSTAGVKKSTAKPKANTAKPRKATTSVSRHHDKLSCVHTLTSSKAPAVVDKPKVVNVTKSGRKTTTTAKPAEKATKRTSKKA